VAGPGRLPADLAALLVMPLALGGTAGALTSVLAGPASVSEGWALAPPEAQGIRLAVRTAWPPSIAVIGACGVLLARNAYDDGRPPLAAAQPLTVGMLVLFALVCGWVRVRDDIADWFRSQMQPPAADRGAPTDADT
jgi:hypothetical protein